MSKYSILAGLALAACHMKTPSSGSGSGSGSSGMQASGPQTLTVDVRAIGLVTSDPAGIECGQCNLPLGSTPPCADTDVHTACSADFDAGTEIKLFLGGQRIYFATSCSSPEAPGANGIIPQCTFTIEEPMLVTVNGVEA
jgi:hypothetical protein